MRTWSYTIMGNSEASTYWFCFSDYIWSYLTDNEINTLRDIPDERIRSIINEHYDDLVKLAIEQKSRLSYQVLAVFLMDFGAKMTNELREIILKHSKWEDEKYQLFDEKDRLERLYYLSEFREKVITYREGAKTSISWESNAQVVEKLRDQGIINTNYPLIVAPDRIPIDYRIKD